MNKLIAIASLIVLVWGGSYLYTTMTEDVIQTTVTRSERECKSTDDCKYMIYTTNEVLTNQDSWWYFKFNSSDFHNKITVGKKYEFTVYGWRVPFLSWYRNVVDYKEVE